MMFCCYSESQTTPLHYTLHHLLLRWRITHSRHCISAPTYLQQSSEFENTYLSLSLIAKSPGLSTMKTHHPKQKTAPRPLFSCGFFRHCTQTVHSPTNPHPPPLSLPQSDTLTLPPPPPPPPPPLPSPSNPPPHQDSSSSSSSTSQSFTQWRFPFPTSPLLNHHPSPPPESDPPPSLPSPSGHLTLEYTPLSDPPPPLLCTDLQELFHLSELQLSTGSDSDRLAALHLLERSLVPNPQPDPVCPPALMRGVVRYLKDRVGAKPATKILMALCLGEANRHVAVEVGAVGWVVEALTDLEDAAAERALAALELMCTVAEGAAEVRAHALAVPVMVEMMGRMAARGKEYAIGVLAVIFGGGGSGEEVAVVPPPEEMARAVMLALQGDCSVRGKRKGAQLLRALQENGPLDLADERC